jgi:hypothetical protein
MLALWQQQFEDACLFCVAVYLHRKLCVFKCFANTFLLLENCGIKCTREMQDSFISDFVRAVYANYVLSSCLKENATNKF